jgi:hypothetical protein
MMPATMPPPPKRNLRFDRLLGALIVLGGIGFAVYWFAIR